MVTIINLRKIFIKLDKLLLFEKIEKIAYIRGNKKKKNMAGNDQIK